MRSIHKQQWYVTMDSPHSRECPLHNPHKDLQILKHMLQQPRFSLIIRMSVKCRTQKSIPRENTFNLY